MVVKNNRTQTKIQIKQKGYFIRIRNYFLTGLVLIGPLILTVAILLWLVDLIDSGVISFLSLFSIKVEHSFFINIPGFGVVVVTLLLILVGFLGTNFFGKCFFNIGEKIVSRVPIIKAIYGTIKQILNTLFSKDSNAFKSVVLVQFPCKGSWSIGFITSEVKEGQGVLGNAFKSTVKKDTNLKKNSDETKKSSNDDSETHSGMVSVFLPTTPNPTSGFLLYVSRADIKELDITPNVAMKVIISGGSLTSSDVESIKKQ